MKHIYIEKRKTPVMTNIMSKARKKTEMLPQI
jgi:hypothetical protein